MLARRDLQTDVDLVEAARSVGFSLAWDRAGPAELEARSWTITPDVGRWPVHEQAALHSVSTAVLRAYIVGIVNTVNIATKKLGVIKSYVLEQTIVI